MSENTLPENVASLNYDRLQHAREEAAWAPLSPAERRQWTTGLLDFRPDIETPMTNRMLEDMVNRTGVISLERWVEPVRAFDAAGFTPQDWLEIMTSLHVVLARQPEIVLDNPAVTMVAKHPLTSRVAITPDAWLGWLPLRRSGASALSATRTVLRTVR